MTTVLVHGNPETAAVWDPLLRALDYRAAVQPRIASDGAGLAAAARRPGSP